MGVRPIVKFRFLLATALPQLFAIEFDVLVAKNIGIVPFAGQVGPSYAVSFIISGNCSHFLYYAQLHGAG